MGSVDCIPVTIIGGGLAGLSLAIALHEQSISCKIYELRSPGFSHGGAVMLSPNALRILDTLGVYERVRNKGYHFETIAFKDDKHETTGLYYFGNQELYGYKAVRIYRQVLISELLLMINERHIPIEFDKKFSHIISESEEGVSFAFTDGIIQHTSLLVGADGIHSKVRRYISPTAAPKYSGQLAMTYALQRSHLRFPPAMTYHLPAAISSPKNGMFVLAPQSVDGEELLAGTQRTYPETDRAGWDKLYNSKDELLQLIQTNMENWPDMVQSALEHVPLDTLTIWPFYTLPCLPQWSSPSAKVLILGDAAHAIPPTAGQGVNQAFEDIYMLSLLLSKQPSSNIPMRETLKFWQEKRQERVDGVLELTRQMNNKRLPKEEREKLGEGQVWDEKKGGGAGEEMRWLYLPGIEEAVEGWFGGELNGDNKSC